MGARRRFCGQIAHTGLLQDNMEPTLTRAWHFHSKVDQNLTAQIDPGGPRGPRVDWTEKKSRLGLGAGNSGFFNFLLRAAVQSAHEAQAQPGSNEVRHAWSKHDPEVPCPARAARAASSSPIKFLEVSYCTLPKFHSSGFERLRTHN